MFPDPPAPTLADESGPLPFDVYNTAFTNAHGKYFARIRYPLTDVEAPYPAVVVAPGYCGIREVYNWIGFHLASHGYVVLAFTPPTFCQPTQENIDGIVSALEFLDAEGADPASRLFGLVDSTKHVAMGHSLGANASLILASQGADLDAVVALAADSIDPAELAAITVPTQIHGGSMDCVTEPASQRFDYDALTDIPRQLVVVGGGNHVGFTDEFSVGDILGPPLSGDCPRAILGKDHQQRLSRRYFTAWLDYQVKGLVGARDFLDGAQAGQDQADGWFTDFAAALD